MSHSGEFLFQNDGQKMILRIQVVVLILVLPLLVTCKSFLDFPVNNAVENSSLENGSIRPSFKVFFKMNNLKICTGELIGNEGNSLVSVNLSCDDDNDGIMKFQFTTEPTLVTGYFILRGGERGIVYLLRVNQDTFVARQISYRSHGKP